MSNAAALMPGFESDAGAPGAPGDPSPDRNDPPAGPRSEPARLSLNSFLPYRLNVLAQTVSGAFADAYSEAFGITAPEWRIVSTLGEFREMTATEISNHSGMHKATISRAVLSLEKRALLTRNPNAADRREEILILTAEGRRVYETIAPMALRYEQNLLQGLGAADLKDLDRLIHHLMERAGAPWQRAE
jgi:DNA-binding MarR family transcriptional regulator